MRIAPIVLLTTSLSLAACSPCVERCRAESRAISSCLDDWGLDWGQLNATNAQDFREQCIAADRLWLDALDDDERKAEQGVCSELTVDLRAADDCAARWEALVSYGDAS
jgi:hypothetical protein